VVTAETAAAVVVTLEVATSEHAPLQSP
jgi:hypothetical protein